MVHHRRGPPRRRRRRPRSFSGKYPRTGVSKTRWNVARSTLSRKRWKRARLGSRRYEATMYISRRLKVINEYGTRNKRRRERRGEERGEEESRISQTRVIRFLFSFTRLDDFSRRHPGSRDGRRRRQRGRWEEDAKRCSRTASIYKTRANKRRN